ncbi:hypothetical protein AB0L41_08310 [Amycolatopsis mediterranei]|uniref:TetR family transcriptional regulator C-terminal domain-containing protein n=1 Tax=Amycolatopsis mediterranei TaxID=33910 RepID=UPI0034450F87
MLVSTRAGWWWPSADIDQLLYEIVAIMLALNHFLQLHGDRRAPARARRALERLL